MFWRPAKGCDEAHCHHSSGEQIEPLIAAKGFKWFEIDGAHDGREYTGTVLLCPDHSEQMEAHIRGERAGLYFSSFEGGEKREPTWAAAA